MTNRIISKECYQAETRLLKLRADRDKSVDAVKEKWEQKISDFISDIPDDVRAKLQAMGVIGGGE